MSPGHERHERAPALGLRVGEWVEVKSVEEILATLDVEGALEALPLMPEMLRYCGRRFRVHKSAHKACDTIQTWRTRRMKDAVHLEGVRCGGDAHGGCQAGCLLHWKEAWLKRASAPGPSAMETNGHPAPQAPLPAALEALERGTRPAGAGGQEVYRCQATEMLRATTPTRWDPTLYWKDLQTGNVGTWEFVRFGLYAVLNHFRRLPHVRGRAGRRATPPGEPLDLQAGEWVRVRSKDEILATLSRNLRHRGLSFDLEMLPYCGRTFRVMRRVERLVDDRTGRMIRPRTACLILEGAVCSGCRSRHRMFCPRGIYPYWHEIWLERVTVGSVAPAASTRASAAFTRASAAFTRASAAFTRASAAFTRAPAAATRAPAASTRAPAAPTHAPAASTHAE
jgi:hypothetical protein